MGLLQELIPTDTPPEGKRRLCGNLGCQAQSYSGTPLRSWDHDTSKGNSTDLYSFSRPRGGPNPTLGGLHTLQQDSLTYMVPLNLQEQPVSCCLYCSPLQTRKLRL